MTGFYPIHTAVRAGNVKSVMFLIQRFGREQLGWRANGYTALVLAARSGRQSMVVHMLNERTLQKWVWGRLAKFTYANPNPNHHTPLIPQRGPPPRGSAI